MFGVRHHVTAPQGTQPGCPRSRSFAVKRLLIWRAFTRFVLVWGEGCDLKAQPPFPLWEYFQNGPRVGSAGPTHVPGRSSTIYNTPRPPPPSQHQIFELIFATKKDCLD